MIGLEKTKAAAGEVSQSACALTLKDMHKLYVLCLETLGLSFGEYHWGVVRYVSSFTLNTISEYSVQHLKTIFLLAWLLLLRIEEAVHLEFESIDFHPGECMFHFTFCCIVT